MPDNGDSMLGIGGLKVKGGRYTVQGTNRRHVRAWLWLGKAGRRARSI